MKLTRDGSILAANVLRQGWVKLELRETKCLAQLLAEVYKIGINARFSAGDMHEPSDASGVEPITPLLRGCEQAQLRAEHVRREEAV
jgi:hypothetical protein